MPSIGKRLSRLLSLATALASTPAPHEFTAIRGNSAVGRRNLSTDRKQFGQFGLADRADSFAATRVVFR